MKQSKETTEQTKAPLKQRLSHKLLGRKKAPSIRITNDNIDEHREDILARGRKLKYPMQYSKKSLIITCIVVVVVALGAFAAWLYHSLYKQQQTGDFYYSVSKILPLPVAKVDGQPVSYQNYLRRLRADIHYYLNREGRSFNSSEGAKELDYHKRKNLTVAERSTYVENVAKQHGVTVSDDEVDAKIKAMREADNATEELLVSTIESYYGWSLDDFKVTVRDQLLEQKVAYQVDQAAKTKIDKVQTRLKAGEDFAVVAKEMSDDSATKDNGGAVTAKITDSDPTGIIDAVKKLSVDQTTGVNRVQIDGTNYYYIAKLTAKSDDNLSYSIIMVKLSKLDDDFAKLQKDGKIKEFITVPPESDFNGN